MNYDLRSIVNKVGPFDFLIFVCFLDRIFCFCFHFFFSFFHTAIRIINHGFEYICPTVIMIKIKRKTFSNFSGESHAGAEAFHFLLPLGFYNE
jgi:hypothetical protein